MNKTAHLELETVQGTGLRFRVRTDTGFEYRLDSGADATAPSPVDVLLASLGGCTGMDVIFILRKKRLDVTAYSIDLVGQRRDDHPKAYTAMEVVHRVRGRGLPRAAVEEAVRLSEEKYCSVHATIAPGVKLTSRVEVEEESTVAG